MTDWNAISAFMASVVPWPASQQDPGFVNLHYTSEDRNQNPASPPRKGGVKGWPYRSVDQFVNRVAWMGTVTQFKDVWFCLSLQSQTKPSKNNPSKLHAHRLTANALKVKAIWADVDVGTKPGEYATVEDALKAVIQFRERHSLPPFSAIVGSGGGIQIYWISTTAMTVKEWAPYAEGLRALMLQDKLVKDPGVTTDVARILRVPGTRNHKYDPPAPVRLFNVPLVMYDFPTQLAVLPTIAPAAHTVQVNKSAPSIFADGVDASLFVKPAFTINDGTSLQGGIDKHADILLKAPPIFKECGFYQHALLTGGVDYSQPLWMLSVLGATFMENGNAIAHAISKGHPSYSPDDTQALYDRKVAERADRGIGYPSCAAIAGAGSEACKTCPLFAKGKSPLNIRPVVTATVTQAVTPHVQSQPALDMNLPYGYELNDAGIICEVVQKELNGEPLPPELLPLFMSRLSDPWAQSEPDSLNFTTTVDLGTTHNACIRHEEMTTMALEKAYARERVKIFPKHKARLEQFTMSWLNKLHEIAAAQKAMPYGWHTDNGTRDGFVYAGTFYKDTGEEIKCGVGDPQIRQVFYPTGDIQHWYDAAACITNQKRPELDAIIALSFSAPLTELAGKNAVTLCAYGDSGVGKSAAYAVGVGVWGHPVKGKQSTHSTHNRVMKDMTELNHLPLYWDEIKEEKSQRMVYDVLYDATMGVEKGRMLDGKRAQSRGTWSTQVMLASNVSFTDYILLKDKGHVAGLSRVLEYHVKLAENPVGRISPTEADLIIRKMNASHGMIGALYAKFLAVNHKQVEHEVLMSCKQVEQDLQRSEPERMWVSLVGTLLVGAKYANQLGANLDLPALKTFLYDVFERNRQKRDSLATIAGSAASIEEVMTEYFARAEARDQVLWTRGMAGGAYSLSGGSKVGRPAQAHIEVLRQPRDTKNVSVTAGIAVRWDLRNQTCYVLKSDLRKFLEDEKMPIGTTFDALQRDYGMKFMPKVRIGAGAFTTGRATCCVFENIGPDHEFAEVMYKVLSPDQRPGGSDDPEKQQPVETGLTPVEDVVAFVQGATRGA